MSPVCPKGQKANPVAGGTGDNPSYRDNVNALMLSYTLGKAVTIWIDGCVGGYPRVVGVMLSP
jgi:hypothetical protein